MDGAPRMLLEHIVDVLETRDFAFANDVDAFVHPADGRTERNAVVTNFAGAFELLEGFPNCVICHLLHSNVVQLQQIDSIRFQSLQRRLRRTHNCVRRKILRDLALPASAGFAMSDEIVANLGGDHDFIAIFGEGLCDVFLAQAVAVSIGRIK